AIPEDSADLDRTAEILEPLGERVNSTKGVAVRLDDGHVGLASAVGAFAASGLRCEKIQLHQPSLDDVFLAKTGRSLEGAGDEEEEEPEADGLALESAGALSSTRSISSAAARWFERCASRRT